MIAPRTLANFQSLPKLIALIINHFFSHCTGDWQIALTKQNIFFGQPHLLFNHYFNTLVLYFLHKS